MIWDVTFGDFVSFFLNSQDFMLSAMAHYGYPTEVLDVSFDPWVVLWFATHTSLDLGDNFFTYKTIESINTKKKAEYNAVIYVSSTVSSRFLSTITTTAEMLEQPMWPFKTIDLSSHVLDEETRPFHQKAAFLFDSFFSRRGGYENIYCMGVTKKIFLSQKLLSSLKDEKLPLSHSFKSMFPNPKQDRLYKLLFESDPQNVAKYIYSDQLDDFHRLSNSKKKLEYFMDFYNLSKLSNKCKRHLIGWIV